VGFLDDTNDEITQTLIFLNLNYRHFVYLSESAREPERRSLGQSTLCGSYARDTLYSEDGSAT